MKTSKQQLLAMLRHRLLPERSRRATRWHVLMLMLALLLGGSPQARAQEWHYQYKWHSSWDKTSDDVSGVGKYKFKGYCFASGTIGDKLWDPTDYGHLETIKSFDPGNDQFGWEFKIRVNLFYGQWYTTFPEYGLRYSGEICVVTSV